MNTISENDFDHLIYLRVFEGCNLHCDHCFIPSNPKKMDISIFKKIYKDVGRFAKKGQRLHFQWHGGEPTLMGAKYLEEAIEIINTSLSDYIVSHGIQTNLINLSDDILSVLGKYFKNNTGISYDPKIRKYKSRPESNSEYELKFWKNVEKLIDYGVDPYLIITGTKVFFQEYKNPVRLFNLLEENRIKRLNIEKLTKTGYARENWDWLGVSNLDYSKYMSTLATAYLSYKKTPRKEKQSFNISPFDGLFQDIKDLRNGLSGGSGCLSGVCDSKFHTIDANGYKFGCTALNSEVDNKASARSGLQILEIKNIKKDRESRTIDCQKCDYVKICSSGCLASEKIDESGECSGSYNLFKRIDIIS